MQPPPIITPTRPRLAWWIGGGLLLLLSVAAAVVFFRFNPSKYPFYPRCMLYTTTGIYCPGCGSQRALYYLLHGDISSALRCNLLLVMSQPLLVVVALRCVVRLWRNQPLPAFVPRPWQIKLVVAVLILFTVLRNLRFAPFTYLAPM